jgi:hypothetical protein
MKNLIYLVVGLTTVFALWSCSSEMNDNDGDYGSAFVGNGNSNQSDITYDTDQTYCDGPGGGSSSGILTIFLYDNSLPMNIVLPEPRCEVKCVLRKYSNGVLYASEFTFNTYNSGWYRHSFVSYGISEYGTDSYGNPADYTLSITYQTEEKVLSLDGLTVVGWAQSEMKTITVNFVRP